MSDPAIAARQTASNQRSVNEGVYDGFYMPYGTDQDSVCRGNDARLISTVSPNGAVWTRGQLSEVITLSNSALATDSVANLLPAGAIIEAVVANITVAISGGSNAKGTITLTGLPVADETFRVDSQTFTWKASRGGVGQVTIGASAAAACTNIIAAITADLLTVTATQGTGTTVVITAVVEGTAGNSIIFTEASTNLTVDGSGTLATGAPTTGYQVGDPTTATRFSGTISTLTAGVVAPLLAHRQGGISTDATGPVQAAAAKLRITAVGAPPDAGKISVTVFYSQFTAPTT